MEKAWYLQYDDSSITEELFNILVGKLIEKGMRQYSHAGLGTGYDHFKFNGFLRTGICESIGDASMQESYNRFCIDNNHQSIRTQYTIHQLLSFLSSFQPFSEPSYEIY